MIIGIDIDNVITDTTNGVLKYINDRLPLNMKPEDITEYWMEKSMPEQYRWIISEAFDNKRMWKNVKMIEGAAEAIGILYNQGDEIYFVTSTSPENFKKKIKFLKRNLPIPEDYIDSHCISIKNKQLLNLSILIDDCLDNLVGERSYYSICFDYPWNRNIVSMPNFVRAKDWNEILEQILTYKDLQIK